MSRTTLRPAVAMTYPLTMGHRAAAQGQAEIIRPAFNNAAMWPGGSIYSNVRELSRFVIALLDGGRLGGVRVVTHGGASAGYGSTIQLAPERRFAVITLTNRSGETLPRTRDKAMELALPLKAPEPEVAAATQPIGDAEMGAYIGVYSHAPQTWEVFIKDARLYLKHDGAEKPLTKVGPHTFSTGAGQIVFTTEADGRAEHLFMGLYSARRTRDGR